MCKCADEIRTQPPLIPCLLSMVRQNHLDFQIENWGNLYSYMKIKTIKKERIKFLS